MTTTTTTTTTTTNTTGITQTNASPLLLPPLLQALATSRLRDISKCHSVQDCLRTTTKKFPAKPVEQILGFADGGGGGVLDDNPIMTIRVDSASIRVSFAKILTETLDQIRNENCQNSTLAVLQDLVLVFDFLQLLLELHHHVSKNNKEKENKNDGATKDGNGRIDIKDKEVVDILHNLLRSLVGVLRSCLEKCDTVAVTPISDKDVNTKTDREETNAFNDEDELYMHEYSRESVAEIGHFQPRLVAYFAWHFLLRLCSTYILQTPRHVTHFWKAICDLSAAMSTATRPLAPALVHDALKVLVGVLRKGTLPIFHGFLQQQQQQNQGKLKLVAFFFGRLLFFLQRLLPIHGDTEETDSKRARNLNHLLEQLAIWTGIKQFLLEGNSSISLSLAEELTTVADKSHRCFEILHDKCPYLVNDTLLAMPSFRLPQAEPIDPNSEVATKQITTCASTLGKASFLVRSTRNLRLALEQPDAADSVDKMERLLHSVRNLIFQTLPSCLSIQQQEQYFKAMKKTSESTCCDRMLVECIAEISQALRLAMEFEQQPHRIHRMVLSWLPLASSSDGHPMAREVLMSVVVQSIILEKEDDDGVRHFVHLMVRLLVDGRTHRPIRIMVGAILRRVMLYWKSLLGSQTNPLKENIEQWLVHAVQELVQKWQPKGNTTKGDSKKRKRPKQKQSAAEQSPKINVEDLHMIGQLLLLIPATVVQPILDSLGAMKNSISESKTKCELMKATLAVYCNCPDSSLSLTKVVPLLCSNQFRPRMTAALDALILALLFRQDRQACDSARAMKNSELQNLLQLASHVLSMEENNRRGALVPGLIRAFGSMGRVASSQPSDDLLGRFSSTFQQIFSTSDWCFTAFAVSSIDRFSRQMPDKYKRTIPLCVTSTSKAMMTMRIKKKPYIPASLKDPSRLRVIQQSYCQCLSRMWGQARLPKSVFPPGPSLITIQQGSYVMTMHTQEGRSATVIFEPCQASLEDIGYMLGDDEDGHAIFQVKRAVALPEQGGCKLLLQPAASISNLNGRDRVS